MLLPLCLPSSSPFRHCSAFVNSFCLSEPRYPARPESTSSPKGHPVAHKHIPLLLLRNLQFSPKQYVVTLASSYRPLQGPDCPCACPRRLVSGTRSTAPKVMVIMCRPPVPGFDCYRLCSNFIAGYGNIRTRCPAFSANYPIAF